MNHAGVMGGRDGGKGGSRGVSSPQLVHVVRLLLRSTAQNIPAVRPLQPRFLATSSLSALVPVGVRSFPSLELFSQRTRAFQTPVPDAGFRQDAQQACHLQLGDLFECLHGGGQAGGEIYSVRVLALATRLFLWGDRHDHPRGGTPMVFGVPWCLSCSSWVVYGSHGAVSVRKISMNSICGVVHQLLESPDRLGGWGRLIVIEGGLGRLGFYYNFFVRWSTWVILIMQTMLHRNACPAKYTAYEDPLRTMALFL